MESSVEFCQTVARSINSTTWNIPRIKGDRTWRNIKNGHLVENLTHLNGYDRYEDAIVRIRDFVRQRGWKTELTDLKQWCHEHLYYQRYRLKCWK